MRDYSETYLECFDNDVVAYPIAKKCGTCGHSPTQRPVSDFTGITGYLLWCIRCPDNACFGITRNTALQDWNKTQGGKQ